MIQLKADAQIIFLKNSSVAIRSHKSLLIEDLSGDEYKLLDALVSGISDEAFDQNSRIYHILKENEFLIKKTPATRLDQFLERQVDFLYAKCVEPENVQSKIEQQKILIIGCGGTGSMLVQLLLGHGFKKFILVDGDTVQKNNFNRQLFFTRDSLNKSKVTALKESILRLSPDSEVECESIFIDSLERLQNIIVQYEPTFVFNGADTPPVLIQKCITQAALKFKLPVLFGGIGIDNCNLGPLLSTDRAKERYLKSLEQLCDVVDVAKLKPIKASLASTNMMGTSFLALEIFRYFSSLESVCLNKKINFNFNTLKIESEESFL